MLPRFVKSKSKRALSAALLVAALVAFPVSLRAEPSGAVWRQVPGGSNLWLRAVSCPSVSRCFAVGANGAIVSTSDGGSTWTELTRPGGERWTSSQLWDVTFPTEDNGFAVGGYGTVLVTSDGGKTWSDQVATAPQRTFYDLYGVSFINANLGAAVGPVDTILVTEDGGRVWEPRVPRNASAYRDLTDVAWVTPDVAVAVGRAYGGLALLSPGSNLIVISRDGGLTWTPQSAPTNLDAVDFGTQQRGAAVGGGGTIVVTNNGGGTWIPRPSGTGANLKDIAFADANHAIAVGDNGTILVTDDGGETWTREAIGISENLSGVASPSSAKAVVVGDADNILIREAPASAPDPTPTLSLIHI